MACCGGAAPREVQHTVYDNRACTRANETYFSRKFVRADGDQTKPFKDQQPVDYVAVPDPYFEDALVSEEDKTRPVKQDEYLMAKCELRNG